LADALRGHFDDIEVELIQGSGGAFEVRREGEMVFSKLRVGRFPELEEIIKVLGG
jgi:selT/selW/selH-like putative selenoprotein